jgi:hypothetical protein
LLQLKCPALGKMPQGEVHAVVLSGQSKGSGVTPTRKSSNKCEQLAALNAAKLKQGMGGRVLTRRQCVIASQAKPLAARQ